MKSLIRPLLSATLILLSVLSLLNVYSDNADVVKQAEGVACTGCTLHQVREGRSPIAQKFEFQINQTAEVVKVTCERALVFVGDYSCALTP